MTSIPERIASELSARTAQVEAAIALLDGGATVPFVARYRKEATGGLDDTQLRTLETRLAYLRELEERRAVILESIEGQGKLGDALRAQILAADTKVRLEDLYLPYKPKRRTKAMIAREAGLEPLADLLLADPTRVPAQEAARFVSAEKGVADADQALEGARAILIERFAEDAQLLGELRKSAQDVARITSKVIEGKQKEAVKFSDYFEHEEPLATIPSHRALALLRGRNAGFLDVRVELEPESQPGVPEGAVFTGKVAKRFQIADQKRPGDRFLVDTAGLAWRTRIGPHLEVDLTVEAREKAEAEAITVFGKNLRDLLLTAPAGARITMGLDPGIRTGVKVAVVDATGKLLDTATVYPHEPRNEWDRSLLVLSALCKKHGVQLVAIGNGTASRETDKLATLAIQKLPEQKVDKLVVSEAGASVYSASELASKELPELDVTLRGAVSIARRLQDPLAELVKIEPKAIGVGQYQHDLDQRRLSKALDGVVEDCVNAVGVEVNTASPALLQRVAGLNETLAKNIVAHRDANGPFQTRKALRDVPRLGPKAFEQAAGFLRIRGGDDPLDASAVHPEAYPLVARILERSGKRLDQLIGDRAFLRGVKPDAFADASFGVPTVVDVLAELEKPGRDPRPEFKTASFKEGVTEVSDLQPDMVLEGVVTNVANFGAFVDIGVHQDGLVHISQLSDRFVKDPREVVKAGDVVKVKVLSVDVERKRIALTLRLSERGARPEPGARPATRPAQPTRRAEPEPESPLALALKKLASKAGGPGAGTRDGNA